MFGAALLYGDGIITPAISVLSAVEGLEIATPHHPGLLKDYVVPITIAIIGLQLAPPLPSTDWHLLGQCCRWWCS